MIIMWHTGCMGYVYGDYKREYIRIEGRYVTL